MSVAASHLPADLPTEPFGQAGVRQYFGRIVAWLFLTVGLCAAAMSHRSGRFSDELVWTGRGQRLEIVSAQGQLAIVGAARRNATNEGTGWQFGGGYDRRPRALQEAWRTDFGDAIGLEGMIGPPNPRVDSGFFVRAKWASVAVLFLLWPLVYGVKKIVRLVRPRTD